VLTYHLLYMFVTGTQVFYRACYLSW